MSRERPGRGDWRLQRAAGVALIVAGIAIATTRENASETLVGTLLGFGVLLLGLTLPRQLPFGMGRRDEEDPKP